MIPPRISKGAAMKKPLKDSSSSSTTLFPAFYLVSFTDGISSPSYLWDIPDAQGKKTRVGSANSLPEALDLASDFMAEFVKESTVAGCDVPEEAQCFIDLRVCSSRGTTTQTVHLIG
jgi:hypothetical protein